MSEAVAELLERVRALTPEERELFEVGFDEEVVTGDPMVDPDFLAELDRRIAAVGDGTAVLIDGEEAFCQIRESLRRDRKAASPWTTELPGMHSRISKTQQSITTNVK